MPEAAAKPLDIVLWGPTMAGKTMMLARLYLQSVEFDTPTGGRFSNLLK